MKLENKVCETASPGTLEAGRLSLKSFLPGSLFVAMSGLFFFINAVLPLRGLYFYQTFPATKLEEWLLWPTRILFQGSLLIWPLHFQRVVPGKPAVAVRETFLLFGCFLLVLALYLLALRLLPRLITLRYILLTTTGIGVLCLLSPIVMSQDIFSYIIYARMGVIYHLNPLTTLPTAVPQDPVYPFIYWVHQPSAYGPTWTAITCALQWLALKLSGGNLPSTILLYRAFGLAMHLGSTWLIWLLSGWLQQERGGVDEYKRLLATLAFAWNPLLLIEAVLNVHNDVAILFLVLLAIWCLRKYREGHVHLWSAAVLLALAACLKITMVVLFPGLLIFVWRWRPWHIRLLVGTTVAYAGTLLLLYLPFWNNGLVLHVFSINPGVTRDINSPYEFLTHLYVSLRARHFLYPGPDVGNAIERLSHQGAIVLYILVYALLSLRFLLARQQHILLSFINWLAGAWLLYCFVGSPWLWPWYCITFFGLFAIIEATDAYPPYVTKILRLPLAVRLLSFSLLCLYAFATWGPHTKLIHGLYAMEWTYARGLWVCVIPLLALRVPALSMQCKRGWEWAKQLATRRTSTAN